MQHVFEEGHEPLVEGRLVIRSYDDKDGNKRKATEVVIDNMQMLGSRPAGSGGDEGGGYNGGDRSAAPAHAGRQRRRQLRRRS